MSVVTNSVLKLLSDLSVAADHIVQENASDFSRLGEWAAIVKNSADSIFVESGRERESSSSGGATIPNLTSFVKGRSQRGLRGERVSTVLSEMQKTHLNKIRKGKASTKTRPSRKSSIKTPLRRKSNLNHTIVIGSEDTPTESPQSRKSNLNQTIFIGSGEDTPIDSPPETTGGTKVETSPAPPYSKGASSKMDRRSKRKSSSELSSGDFLKKAKVVEQLSEPIKENAKVEKLTKAKSAYPNIKSSGGFNTSVLKENRTLRSKMETKQEKAVENRKNILALRQQKLQQNKRTREEKLEVEQKMKLEKAKIVKLRSGGNVREKNLKTSTKEATPKANLEKETLYKKEKQTLKKMPEMNLKKAGTLSSFIFKSNEKTPAVKTPKPNETEKKTMNTTYITQGHEPSASGIKGKTLKDPNIGNNSENIKAVSNDKTETLKKGVKTVPKTVKSLNGEKKQLVSTPKTQKKGPESYAITPARSSFVSYDISEIRSDSEDEEQSSNSKPIPSWATGVHLRNTLLQQHHHPIETDELFGNYFEPPDLVAIMGVKKKAYNKRTSSAVWNSSFI